MKINEKWLDHCWVSRNALPVDKAIDSHEPIINPPWWVCHVLYYYYRLSQWQPGQTQVKLWITKGFFLLFLRDYVFSFFFLVVMDGICSVWLKDQVQVIISQHGALDSIWSGWWRFSQSVSVLYFVCVHLMRTTSQSRMRKNKFQLANDSSIR